MANVTPSRGANLPPGDPETLFRVAESQAAHWGRHRHGVIARIREAMPDWPADDVLRGYLIAFSFLGYARGLDERQTR
jgi:hypothetical protein